jgi:hypothetical protein
MTKYDIDEKEALKNLTSVAIAKKEIQLVNIDNRCDWVICMIDAG